MSDAHKAKPAPRWHVQPLRTIETDAPPCFHVPALPERVMLQPTNGEAQIYVPQATIESLREALRQMLADYEAGNYDQQNGETWLVERITDLHAALRTEQPQRCPTCHGEGTLATVASLTGQGVKIPCDACDGTGRVAPSG